MGHNSKLSVVLSLSLLGTPVWGDIRVFTFDDTNNNGIRDTGESLITGLTVVGVDESGNNLTFLDDAAGTFVLPTGVFDGRVRVEVSGYHDQLFAGKNKPTTIFFATDGQSFEVPVLRERPLDPNSTNVLIPCYEKGASLLKKDSPAFVRFPFAARGIAQMFGGDGPNPIADASISQLGSTWGVAYQRSYQRAFAASLLKRHVGLGPQGLGAIYTLDYRSDKPVIGSFNLQDLLPAVGPVIDLGTVRREIVDIEIDETMPYALSTIEDRTRRASYDIDAFDKVGMTGYGDIEMGEDGRTLWIVNTHQRSLIKMDVGEDTLRSNELYLENYLIDDLPGLPNLFFRFRKCINAGGNSNVNGAEAFTDPNHVAWDKNKYSQGGQVGFSQAAFSNTLNNIDKTSSADLYSTFRKGDFSYDIPVPVDETYNLSLHFAEPEDLIEGDRLFDIYLGDQLLMENFDVVKHAGGARKATVLNLQVPSSDKSVKLSFVSKFGAKRKEAILAGLELIGRSISESGVLRPWAIEFHQGKGYLGLISDASYSQSREHLFAYVLSFDPENVAGGFQEELAFPLNYPRERASNAQLKTPQPLRSAAWMPWVYSWDQTMIPTKGEPLSVQNGLLCAYAQPILSEITFTSDGSIILGLMDRWAHQTGHLNYSTRLGDRTLVIGYAAGDILKAFNEGNGLYTLEKTNSDDGVYYRKDDGPSYEGEFFYEENFISPLAHHGEIVTGGQTILKGSNTVAVTVHSPILTKNPFFQYDGLLTQGLHFYDINTGKRTGEYLFVEQFVLGKANGLGDIVVAENAAPPSVGNYVWCDANADGIQDPGEYGIDGIIVSLHDEENALVALDQEVTRNGGEFYFEDLLPNHVYQLRIDLDQLEAKGFSGGVSPLNTGHALIDSDGDDIAIPGFAIIEFMTGNDGLNRDDLDFGFLGPQASDAQKVQCEDVSILPANLPCAPFSISEIRTCASANVNTAVQVYASLSDAEDRTNEIVNDVVVCGMDSIVFARVEVTGDPNCFSVSQIHLMVQPGAGGLIVDFAEVICPTEPFDMLAFLRSQGFRGDASTEFFLDLAHMMPFLGNPTAVVPAFYPFTLFYDDTIVDGGCGVPGSVTLSEIPQTEIFAGNDTSLCGTECIDLTLLQPYFYANGTGATEAVWSTSGTGVFVDDNTFANAHFYCPDANDLENGLVTLTLTVTDDPCATVPPESSVNIYLTAGTPSFLEVPRDTIDCYHPFAMDPEAYDTFPGCRLVLECIDTLKGEVIDYEILLGDCTDIVKQIKRTLRFVYDKQEYLCMDTITIRALPDTLICPPMRDSVYCVPGYLKDENGHPSPLETGVPMAGDIPLWPPLPSECDIAVTYKDFEFNGICPATIKREWYIKNSCTGLEESCVQWIMIFDTTGPVITRLDTAAFMVPISAGSHHCEAEIYIPPIMVEDTCTGVKQVKGMINGQIVELTLNKLTGYYESHTKIKVPVSEVDIRNGIFNPTYVSYEAIDSCHNSSRLDSLPLFIIDRIKPVAVCDKGVNIKVSDSTVWLPATVFDEGSWDNCGIELILARRTDWATACGVDLCDSIFVLGAGDHHDSLYFPVLEKNEHLSQIEAHYAQTIDWLCKDGGSCTLPFLLGWTYDLMKWGTLNCQEHPYPVNDMYFDQILKSMSNNPEYDDLLEAFLPCLMPDDTLIPEEFLSYFVEHQDLYTSFLDELLPAIFTETTHPFNALLDLGKRIGGGWAKEVPFCCEDACTEVMVEVIAMDYWCNWNKCWTTVRVEDKTPPRVIAELGDISISCSAYDVYYRNAVEQAQSGQFENLQSKLGQYDQVYQNSYGEAPAPTAFTVYDSRCDSQLVEKDSLVFDEHYGYIWKTYQTYQTDYRVDSFQRFNGQVSDNCGLQVWEEMPWISLDACGSGFIKRTFKFIGQCTNTQSGHQVDTITRHQIIWVTNDCPISKNMFYVPGDTIVSSCQIQYDETGNVGGQFAPSELGEARFLSTSSCRQVGIGYYDKVYRILGGDQACFKILRTWCFADWCTLGQPIERSWWFSGKYVGKIITCTQKIIVYDSVAPVCDFVDLPGEIIAEGCSLDFRTEVLVQDACGVLDYQWQIISISMGNVVANGEGTISGQETGSFLIAADGLEPDGYTLRSIVTDGCRNESRCQQDFTVIPNKKPTPVCISSITVELNPMDLNQDGESDTAMVTIWAEEFDRSSIAACGGDDSTLDFRLSFDEGEILLPGADANQLTLGCKHAGVNRLRLFVVDENQNWDYCVVNLIVQQNMGGCMQTGDQMGSEAFTFIPYSRLARSEQFRDDHPWEASIGAQPGGIGRQLELINSELAGNSFQLYQNFPNPFTSETSIGFDLPFSDNVQLVIYNLNGNILWERSDSGFQGYNIWKIKAINSLPENGLLYYKLKYKDQVAIKKMVMLR